MRRHQAWGDDFHDRNARVVEIAHHSNRLGAGLGRHSGCRRRQKVVE
ncbi:hypothetical protein I546_4032 [Mycobacterium kansasii 732]|nr:hypothetical protein I546_4032 [Mycobacterium kansasii 732]